MNNYTNKPPNDKATREISLLAGAQEVFSTESVNLQRVRGC